MQAILEAHDAHANWTVLQIGITRFSNCVVVNIDHVIEHAHRSTHSLLELLMIQNHLAVGIGRHVSC